MPATVTYPRDTETGWTPTRPVTAPGAGHHQDAVRVRSRASFGTFACGRDPNRGIPYISGLEAHPEVVTLTLSQ